MGDTGIGVVAGEASHGTVAIDIDTDDPEIRAAILKTLPPTPVTKIGMRGETRFFYGPDITASHSWNISEKRVCDLIGPGRQTVLPPSIHPDTGAPYRWLGAGLEAYAPQDLPLITPDIIGNIGAALVPLGWRPEPPRQGRGNGGGGNGSSGGAADTGFDADTPHRALNNSALACLDRWVPALGLLKCRRARGGFEAVATWRPSSTGRPDDARKCNLKIVPSGIRDFGAGGAGQGRGYTPLDLVMAAHGCDLDTAFKFLSDATGWAGERIDILPESAPEMTEPGAGIAPEGEVESAPRTVPEPPAGLLSGPTAGIDGGLEPYTHSVPGVVGEIIEWIVATARRPNRVLAMAAAIPLVGTLIGRRVAGPTMSATHLYMVGIASTGEGKQHLFNCISNVLIAAGAQEHYGPSSFRSESALVKYVCRAPLSLCCMDELGGHLAKLRAKNAPGHERAILDILRSLWGISFMLMTTPEAVGCQSQQIHSPSLSIFGTSTPDELYQALEGSAESGLFSRFLVMQPSGRSQPATLQTLENSVPAGLAKRCQRLYRWYGDDIELLDLKRLVEQRVTQLPWANAAAQKEYDDFVCMVEDRINHDPALKPFLARTAETGIRLATIRAAGRDFHTAMITADDVRWGLAIAWLAGNQTCNSAQTVVPETERGKWIDRLLGWVRVRNLTGRPATVRFYQQHIRCKLKAAEICDMVSQVIQTGHLRQESDGSLIFVVLPEDA